MSGSLFKSLRFSGEENFRKNLSVTKRPEFFCSPAFSDDGFIEHQEHLFDLPFGARNSAYGGCGWIAAYNLLRAEGKTPEIPALISEAEKGTLLKGVLGTKPFFIRKLLKGFGLFLKPVLRKKFIKSFAKRGFVYYLRRNLSGHFSAFTLAESGKEALYRFYNLGEKSPCIISAKEFIQNEKPLFAMFFIEREK